MAERSDTLAAPEAERALLGAILIEPTLAPPLLDQVAAADFYDTRHETLWDVYAACVKDGVDPDLVTVTDRLRRHHETALMGYLPLLVGDQATLTQVDRYAETIVDYSRRRRLSQLGMRLQQAANNGTDPAVAYGNAMDALDAEVAAFTGGPEVRTARYVDLSWLLTGVRPKIPLPELVLRDDGIGLFYRARVNGIYGVPDGGKTFLAMLAILHAIEQGERGCFLDLDHNGQDEITKRLLALGGDPMRLGDPDWFRYYEISDGEDLIATVDETAAWRPAVAVLDPIGEVIPMLGGKSTDNDDVTVALRRTATRLADADAGVITIDHLPKSREARESGYAIAGTAKKRAANGSYLEAKVIKPLVPGGIGKIALKVSKDRSGGLLQHSPDKYAGLFIVDSTDPEHLDVKIVAGGRTPTADEDLDIEPRLMQRITDYLREAGRPASGTTIAAQLGVRKTDVLAACRRLEEEGYLAAHGTQKSRKYHRLSDYIEGGGSTS